MDCWNLGWVKENSILGKRRAPSPWSLGEHTCDLGTGMMTGDHSQWFVLYLNPIGKILETGPDFNFLLYFQAACTVVYRVLPCFHLNPTCLTSLSALLFINYPDVVLCPNFSISNNEASSASVSSHILACWTQAAAKPYSLFDYEAEGFGPGTFCLP